jgi:transcriptional regulator with XRE-family HTH domain
MGTVQRLEGGGRIPRLDTVVQLAQALGVTVDELAGIKPEVATV